MPTDQERFVQEVLGSFRKNVEREPKDNDELVAFALSGILINAPSLLVASSRTYAQLYTSMFGEPNNAPRFIDVSECIAGLIKALGFVHAACVQYEIQHAVEDALKKDPTGGVS